MSEVKRYGHIGYLVNASDKLCELYPDMTVYVKSSDFDSAIEDLNTVVRQKMAFAEERDAAQSELTAQREELADETRRANVNALNARHAKQDLNTLQHRLTAAEQRNSELVELLRDCKTNLSKVRFMGLHKRIGKVLIAELIKPTQSGASDPCAHSYANKLGCPECGEEFKQDESGASE